MPRSKQSKRPEFSHAEIAAYYRARLPKMPQRGREWRAPCPIHQGTRDSLAVNADTGAAFCHSECGRGWSLVEFEAACNGGDRKAAAVRIADLIGRPAKTARPEIVATYDYTDETGALLFQVCRIEPGKDGAAKDFKQRRKNARGGWTWRVKGTRKVPYRLPQVIGAEQVLIVEGEKDVHTLEAWGFTATCNPEGALKWRAEFGEHFAGKDVVILPDHDDKGKRHAEQVTRSVAPHAARVRVVELPELAEHGDVTDWKFTGGTPEQLRRLIEQAPSAAIDDEEPENDPLKDYRADSRGLWFVDPHHEAQDLFISPPLTVDALTRDFEDRGYGKLVSFRDTERRDRRAVIPHTALLGDGNESLESLVHQGFHPARSRKAKEKLKDYIWNARPARKVRTVNQTGWKQQVFVSPERTIGAGTEEEILFYSELPLEHKLKQSGTLDQWRQEIARRCVGNSRLVFAVSAAFGAALLTPMQHECIGFHFRGLSSTGKTTALRAAGSVWGGGGTTGFLESWRATANGLEARAALHNDALLCLDEISQVSEKQAGEIVYFLGNGTSKSRMTKAITARAAQTFRLIYLSTGERSLSELMAAGGQLAKAGQELRLAEIPADAGAGRGMFEQLHDFEKGNELADAITRASLRYYGTAIVAFLERLAPRLVELAEEVRQTQADFTRAYVSAESAGEVYRLANSFGLIAGAGELAIRLGITGWKEGEARAAIRRCFLAWLETRGSSGSLDIEHGIRAVRAFLEAHGSSRFQDIDKQEQQIINRAGFRERGGPDLFAGDDPDADDSDGFTWLIHENVFRAEICGPYDYRAVFEELAARGMASKPAAGRHLATQRRVPGLGRARFYVILPAIFRGENLELFKTCGDSGDSGDSFSN